MKQRLNRAAAILPDGLRDGVTSHLMANEMDLANLSPGGRRVVSALRNAVIGIPMDDEQDARWRRLGIHPDQKWD